MGTIRGAAQALVPLILALVLARPGDARATFLDTDFYCVNYGCVIAGDGIDFNLYDAFVLATNTCCVAANQPLIQRVGAPVGAGGPVTTVVTGTIAAAATPIPTQSRRMGIDTNADDLANTPFEQAVHGLGA